MKSHSTACGVWYLKWPPEELDGTTQKCGMLIPMEQTLTNGKLKMGGRKYIRHPLLPLSQGRFQPHSHIAHLKKAPMAKQILMLGICCVSSEDSLRSSSQQGNRSFCMAFYPSLTHFSFFFTFNALIFTSRRKLQP